MTKGKLFLLPNHLDVENGRLFDLPLGLEQVVQGLDGIFVESEKAARKFLKYFTFEAPKTFRDLKMVLLNEHSTSQDLKDMVKTLLSGEKWGVVSDCGMPCLADPGSQLIREVRKHKIPIHLFHGPSSITHALIVSGFNAQSFSFHGYLPRDEAELISKLKFLENIIQQTKQTQIFIETPYRNQKLFEIMLKNLNPNIQICVAMDLMTKNEKIILETVATFKKSSTFIPKVPAVFLLNI